MTAQPNLSGLLGVLQIKSATELVAARKRGDLCAPEPIVAGWFHRASVASLAAPSKARKTWLLVQLGLCVANGIPFLGCETTKGRVLFVNFEVQEAFFTERIEKVADALGVGWDGLDVLTLRGQRGSLDDLTGSLAGGDYALVILDPFYRLSAGKVENAAEEVAATMEKIDALARASGAALVFAHHFAKGSAAAKDVLDRASGSGVFARFPDCIITLTPHETEGALTVDVIARNFPPPPPFVIEHNGAVAQRTAELDPAKIRGAKGGRPPTFDVKDVAEVTKKPMRKADIHRALLALEKGRGASEDAAKSAVARALHAGAIRPETEGSALHVRAPREPSGAS